MPWSASPPARWTHGPEGRTRLGSRPTRAASTTLADSVELQLVVVRDSSMLMVAFIGRRLTSWVLKGRGSIARRATPDLSWPSNVNQLLGDYTVRAKSDGEFFRFLVGSVRDRPCQLIGPREAPYCLPTGTASRLPDKNLRISWERVVTRSVSAVCVPDFFGRLGNCLVVRYVVPLFLNYPVTRRVDRSERHFFCAVKR